MKTYNLENISEKLIESINDILEQFNIEFTDYGDRVSFPCPIHGGDNPEGCSILKAGIGNWQCFTHQCHEQYGSSILNFIQALLSVNKEKDIPFRSTLEWCANLVGEESNHVTQEEIEYSKTKTKFMHLYQFATKKRDQCSLFRSREYVKQNIQIPAEYYIKRNFSPEILTKYDVGLCNDSEKSMYQRVVVPFYDDNGEYMIGCSGRIIFDKCPQCNLYHDPNIRCPISKEEKAKCSKWKHSGKMNKSSFLYNYWEAKDKILNSGTVILVEGPGDVWRLEEANIHNSVAILGTSLSDEQCIILEQSGAVNVVIIMDNDEAGKKAANKIYNRLNKIFNVYIYYTEENDIGDSNIYYINTNLKPFLEKIV